LTFEQIIFYFFSAVLVSGALGVVLVRNPVYAALFLILAFFTSAAIWLMLEAEFLGITLVLVYVGAVMVLFLFVIMMLDINMDPLREGFVKMMPLAAVVAIIIAGEIILVMTSGGFDINKVVEHTADYSNTKELGSILYTQYVYPFEIAAVILVVAIIAAIALTLRRREGVKHQNPSKQIRTKRSDRVRLVKMPSASSTNHKAGD
jgi:NADH-quinone oxidoreductase subunit J